MYVFLSHPFLYGFMAGQTEIRAIREQEAFQFRLMRAVALCALPVRYRIVLARAALELLFQVPVAGKAERVLFFHDHAADVASMGIVAGETLAPGERHMVYPASFLFHEISVTLFTEVGTGRLQDLRDVGTVGIMAFVALAARHRRMGIVPGKFHFRVRMTGVADRVHSVLQHVLEIGTVGIMAGNAHFLVEGHVGVLALFRFFRLCMARKTEFPALCQEHFLVLCRMRGMAG